MTVIEQTFGASHFGTVNLGHQQRNRCLVKIAELIHRHPGGTLPEKLHSPKDYKAMDRLMNRAEVTHASVMEPHRQRTLDLMRKAEGPVLVLHDTTELDYSGLRSIGDLGSIGGKEGRGYLCHNSLAYDYQKREVLGLANQILHRRRLVGRKEPIPKKRKRQDRESRLWIDAVSAIERPASKAEPACEEVACETVVREGAASEKPLWIHVADRGSDTFEHLTKHVTEGTWFLIRSSALRIIQPGHETLGERQVTRKFAKSLPLHGTKTVQAGGQDGEPKREAKVGIAYSEVTVHPPQVSRGEYEKKPLKLWLVVVREHETPPGQQEVCWVLLTNVPVKNLADAWERGEWYEIRWVIEELHKGQKTGCGIEDLQFSSSQALKPMIALLSVVAVTLLNLRDAGRDETKANRRAVDYVDSHYVAVLSAWKYKEQRPNLTVKEFYLTLARLGGHMNRKKDHPPGWIVLWKGWMAMQHMLEGAKALGFEIRG